jgi:hypothetical protein
MEQWNSNHRIASALVAKNKIWQSELSKLNNFLLMNYRATLGG